MLSYKGQIFSFIGGVIHSPKLSLLIESTVLEIKFLASFFVFLSSFFFCFFLTIRVVHLAHFFFNQHYLLGLTIIG